MKLYENGNKIRYEPPDLEAAKKTVSGLDYSMACVDGPCATFVLKDADGKVVWERPGYVVP